MTAFLDFDFRRPHEAPADRWRDVRRGNDPRPTLVAGWTVASNGRLTCRWRTDERTGTEPSG
jgi:hypothetical protein